MTENEQNNQTVVPPQTTESAVPEPTPVATVTPPVSQPVTPVNVAPETNIIVKTGKYIFQFPEGTPSEKQAEYMQKVDDSLKTNDRVVIDPKVKIFVQETKEEKLVNEPQPTVTPVPTPVVPQQAQVNINKVVINQPTEDPVKQREEFATLFLEE